MIRDTAFGSRRRFSFRERRTILDARKRFDVILYATGYALDFPFLSRETLGCDAPDLSLFQKIAHPDHDTLFFGGCLRVGCSMWPVAE
ncbi:MAG: hypothetical protein AB8G23_07980 [Myxococcota bacterium]